MLLTLTLLIDEYRRNWAIRYLREANSDLSTAEKIPIEALSISFALTAMRKAQTAVYYSIGDPSYLAQMVNEAIETKEAVKVPTLKLLCDVELFIRYCADRKVPHKAKMIRRAEVLLSVASKLVSMMLSEDS